MPRFADASIPSASMRPGSCAEGPARDASNQGKARICSEYRVLAGTAELRYRRPDCPLGLSRLPAWKNSAPVRFTPSISVKNGKRIVRTIPGEGQ